jgi:hypothetical protein
MFENLNKFTKELVVRGVYSLFELEDKIENYSYILITSNNSGFLLSDLGNEIKPISNLEKVKLGKIITINDISIPGSVIVENT